MRIRSKRSKNWAESLPVVLSALLAISGGFILSWVSWNLEDLHEQTATSHSKTTQDVAKRESPDLAGHVQNADAPPIRTESTTALPFLTGRPSKILSKATGDFGLALISVGLIGLILEAPWMSKYFQGKIARSVVGRDYLAKLTKPELETLQADTLRHYWEIEEKDDRPDLLVYCRDQVESFIAEPFREDVHGTFTVKRTSRDYYDVEETISYTCRAIRGEIQREVKWTTRSEEIKEFQKFKIELKLPNEIWQQFRAKHPGAKQIEIYEMKTANSGDSNDEAEEGDKWDVRRKFQEFVTGWVRPKMQKLKGDRVGYRLDLAVYKNIDKLHVTVQTKYQAPSGRSLTWQMTHPSRKVTGVVNFEGSRFYLETFGVCDQNFHPEDKKADDSPQTFVYDSWLLPESGFVFHFLPPLDGLTT